MIIDDIMEVLTEIKKEKDYAEHKGDYPFVSTYEESLFDRLQELLENAQEMHYNDE